MEIRGELLPELEDSLQCTESWVFINTIQETPRESNMDSYLTIIDFQKLQEWWDKVKNEYTLTEWKYASEYWIETKYLSPNRYLLGKWIEYKIVELTNIFINKIQEK